MVLAENVSKIGIVVGDIMAVGFKMAGVEHVYSDPGMVKALLDRKDMGVIVLTSKIFDVLDEQTRNRVLASVKPAVVILDANEEKMKSYIKKITGAEI